MCNTPFNPSGMQLFPPPPYQITQMPLAHLPSPSKSRRILPTHLVLAVTSSTHHEILLLQDTVRIVHGSSFRNILGLRMEEDLVEPQLKPYDQMDGEGRIYNQPRDRSGKGTLI